MHKYRSLIFSFLVFTIAASAGFLCVKHCIIDYAAEERQALKEISAVGFGITGLIALALSILTYFFFARSEKLKMHAKELTESNQRLREEIVQRKEAEEKSNNIARELEKTFNSTTDFISVHSRDFRIVRTNKALSDFLGIKNEDIIGKHCYGIYHAAESPIPDCPNVKAIELKKTVTEEVYDHKTGRYLIVTASPIINEQDEVIGTVHIAKDITEIKRLEEKLRHAQKMEAVAQLAGGVAHDFNNILAAIMNYGYLLKDLSPGDSGYKDFTEKILVLSEKASRTTQGLLSYSRKQFLELKPQNLNRIIKNVGQVLCNLVGENIDLVVLPSENDLIILADESHIEQCIINLAMNARDPMPDRGMLTIKLEATEINADFICSRGFGVPGLFALLSVTDTDIGADEKTRQKFFEPFFAAKEAGKGIGLDLAMVYGIIKQHKGYIDVYSKPGRSATFKLYFPLIKKY